MPLKKKLLLCYALLSLLALIIGLTIGLTDNEAYYWSWGQKLDLSYYDHPPLHAWTLSFTDYLFGKNNFAVRMPALVSFWVCTLLYIRWAKALKIPWETAISFCISTPLFFVFSWNSIPDILLLPLGLLTILLTQQRRYKMAGLVLGLTLLAKWHGLLLVPGLVFQTWVQEKNIVSAIKKISVPAILAIILQTPVLLWNIHHDWITFKYHLLLRHQSIEPTLTEVITRGMSFWVGYFAFGGIVFTYAAYLFFRKTFQKKRSNHDLILIFYALPFLIIFLLSSIKGQSRIYWTGLTLFPLSLLFLKSLSKAEHRRIQTTSIATFLVTSIVLMSVVWLPVGYFIKPILQTFRDYDIRFSPAGDFSGWKHWSNAEVKKHQDPNGKSLFLASDIRLASQLLWHSDLDFKNVNVLNPIKQYLVWSKPKFSEYSNIVFFGDNRRKINKKEVEKFCDPVDHPPTKIHLHNRLVKVIEQLECSQQKLL